MEENEGTMYDVYIIGSDQVWNKYTNCDPTFLWNLSYGIRKKISIASVLHVNSFRWKIYRNI